MTCAAILPFVRRGRCLTLRHRFARWLLDGRVALQRGRWRWSHPSEDRVKRAFDIAFSAVVLLLLTPVFAVIAVLIKLEDGGPLLFRQVRVGRHGREFRMLKFRSMRPDAEDRLRELLAQNHHKAGVTFKLKDDPRITRVGRWLRKFSLDELPQFYNVLRGDMSVVGPRPPVPREVQLYTLADRRRLAVQPGITCLWQISGRAHIDFHGQVELDVRYIENRSFWRDLVIITKTLPAVLSGTGAY
ncbi:MAG TPA: sugar transferase [Lacunisphaera sp.]|jgi:exopolysaccharide biosynthesis polyprenyl glycosylphosphotransferase|nr:sugar transferase [Lacunisphaera sp.]